MDIYTLRMENKLDISVSKLDAQPEISGDFELFYLNYGMMKHKEKSSFDIVITPKGEAEITKAKASTSCGCTTASPRLVGKSYHIKVTYDTKRFGNIRKSIRVSLRIDGEPSEIFFKLIGKVIS